MVARASPPGGTGDGLTALARADGCADARSAPRVGGTRRPADWRMWHQGRRVKAARSAPEGSLDAPGVGLGTIERRSDAPFWGVAPWLPQSMYVAPPYHVYGEFW